MAKTVAKIKQTNQTSPAYNGGLRLYFTFTKCIAPMAYYITWPDLLLVEFQLGMMHALLVLNILMMNLYYQLMLCANIWKFFREYWRKYRHFPFSLKFIIT